MNANGKAKSIVAPPKAAATTNPPGIRAIPGAGQPLVRFIDPKKVVKKAPPPPPPPPAL